MPQPERLLITLRQAIAAFRQTPGRQGKVVRLPAQGDVLVAGDIHGHVENFRRLLLLADLPSHSQRHLVLQEVIHGPFRYPQGGDKSHQLLDLIAALKCQFPQRVHFLLGNHELAQWQQQLIGKGEEDSLQLFAAGVVAAYGERAEDILAAYGELLAAGNLVVQTPNRVFLSHSLPSARNLARFDLATLEGEEFNPEDFCAGGSIHSLLWGRDFRADHVAAFLARVEADWLITGHIPCPEGYQRPNERQLILDTMGFPACYFLFPLDRPLTEKDIMAGIGTL